jgi:hypothetical protein
VRKALLLSDPSHGRRINRHTDYPPGARYAPGAMVRLFSTEPSRKKGHHFCTEAMDQRRADGAVIPATAEDDHYRAKAVVPPPHRDPHVPVSTGCPAILRSVDSAFGAASKNQKVATEGVLLMPMQETHDTKAP